MDEFLSQLTARFRAEQQEVGKQIAGGDWSDETQAAVDKLVKEFADDFGYDLDEEGQPLEDGDTERITQRETASAAAGGDGAEPEEPEAAEEAEPAAV